MSQVHTGIDRLKSGHALSLSGKRLGLLCNTASTDRDYIHSRVLVDHRWPGRLKALFSPQHGFGGEKQDNMIESSHGRDALFDIPIYSLYGDTRIPTEAMMQAIDVLIVDLQDVGTRVYTFMYTLSYCMEAARQYDKEIVVLDRPNPLGGLVLEGNCLHADCTSFVGRYPIPMRHSLTIGELARLFNGAFEIGCRLQVVPMAGWRREMFFPETGLPWINPSPNLPTYSSALVYPGQVIWEGTNVSEGRGTALPFELMGAPYLDTRRILAGLDPQVTRGVVLREVAFEPTANKWAGSTCNGFQIHVVDPRACRPLSLSLSILAAILNNHPRDFSWKAPPYEYEFEKMPIDLILGNDVIRRQLKAGDPLKDIMTGWHSEIERFRELCRPFMLYE